MHNLQIERNVYILNINFVFCFDAIKEIRNNLWIILYHIFEN